MVMIRYCFPLTKSTVCYSNSEYCSTANITAITVTTYHINHYKSTCKCLQGTKVVVDKGKIVHFEEFFFRGQRSNERASGKNQIETASMGSG
jgi:hypothetical protein